MKIVLFRHAHKGFTPFDDPELSAQGFAQADQILRLVQRGVLPQPDELLVSPKRRTSQTFYKLSKEFSLVCRVTPELDQRSGEETARDFHFRIQKLINEITNHSHLNKTVFLCTHYDWIEEAMSLIPCDRDLNSFEFSHWAPTQFIVFEVQENRWKFILKGEAQ